MPQAYVQKLAKKHGVSVSSAEKMWERAKTSAEKQGHEEDFEYVTGVFKRMMGEGYTKYGPGDEQTWGSPTSGTNDPRLDDDGDDMWTDGLEDPEELSKEDGETEKEFLVRQQRLERENEAIIRKRKQKAKEDAMSEGYSITLAAGDGKSTKKFKQFSGVEKYLKDQLGMSLDDFTDYRLERTVDWSKVLDKEGHFVLVDDNGRRFIVNKLNESSAMDEFLARGGKIKEIPPEKEPTEHQKQMSMASRKIGKGGIAGGKKGGKMGKNARVFSRAAVVGEARELSFKVYLMETSDVDMWTADSGDFDKDHPEMFHTIGNYASKEEAQAALAKCSNKRIMGPIHKRRGPASWLKQGPK